MKNALGYGSASLLLVLGLSWACGKVEDLRESVQGQTIARGDG
jgi:hypothetical protein